MNLNDFSWETFSQTGDIEAYLLYKSVMELEKTKNEGEQWLPSKQEVSL